MASKRKTPKVRIARPTNRPFQLRYTCPEQGREVRVSTGTRDEDKAQELKAELEAKLLLGIETTAKAKRVFGPQMRWDDFREEYRTQYLVSLRDDTATHNESRLDIAERILKPKTLGCVADQDALELLQSRLLAGAGGKLKKNKKIRERSPHTVRSYMAAVIASLNWGKKKKWLTEVPEIIKIKVAKLKHMKGRPITTEEFERMIGKVPSVVGESAAPSWEHVLRGLWQSALRLDELMHVSWDNHNMICPQWPPRRLAVLCIPHDMQKNDTEEAIPLLPWFEQVLLQTPMDARTGWVFRPESLQEHAGRKPRHGRPTTDWVGKVISRIGKAAGVVVDEGDEKKERPPKFASAHDLRRSCAERLVDAEVPEKVVARVMRHASWETTKKHYAPGKVQKDAAILNELLKVEPPDSQLCT